MLTSEQKTKNMKAVKSKGSKIEKLLAKELWGRGLRYRKNDKTVFGTPDFVFKGLKIAVFCDSEFWHGKDWEVRKNDFKSNQDFWLPKIERNIERDKEVNEYLLKNGWSVIRFWGEEIEKDAHRCMLRVEKEVAKKRKNNKSLKYSEIKTRMKHNILNEKSEDLAYLTHYLHHSDKDISKYYKTHAENYMSSMVAEPTQGYLELDFDVPFPPVENPKFTFIDLFAGVGGFRMAMQNLNGSCVFSSEIDKYAKITYDFNFGEVPFGDITKIDEKDIPEHDVLCAGFPCQAFSIAGKRKGFEDETRGTLFFDIARIIKAKKPKAFFLENVKGLRNHDKGKTLKTILKVLREDLNYYVPEPEIINAKHFGVPQNRERIFIVGFRKDLKKAEFEYPKPINKKVFFSDVKEEKTVSVKYYLSTRYQDTLRNHKERHKSKGNGFGYEIIKDNQCANAIVVGGMGRERNIVIDNRLTDFTPVTKIKGEVNRDGWRRMTPREWARLQGFPDEFEIKVSDAQAYKQFGNSVSIPAIQATAKKIIMQLEG